MQSVGTVHQGTVHLVHGGQCCPRIYTTHTLHARYISLSLFRISDLTLSSGRTRGCLRERIAFSCAARARVLVVFSCAWSLSLLCVPPRILGRSPTRVVCPGILERSQSLVLARGAIPESPPVLHIGHRVPLSDRILGLRVFASINLCYPQHPPDLAERGIGRGPQLIQGARRHAAADLMTDQAMVDALQNFADSLPEKLRKAISVVSRSSDSDNIERVCNKGLTPG